MRSAVDTTLFSSWRIVEEVADQTDLLLIDLKLMDDELHEKYTGVSNKVILANIEQVAQKSVAMRIRIPMIPGISVV